MKKKIVPILSITCVILVIICLSVLSYIRNSVPKNPAGTIGNTAGNIYNNGLFCENDGYVYFANAYDGFSLYSMRPDESEMKKLTPTKVSSINADGKYLYYYQSAINNGTGLGFVLSTTGIYRINKKDASNPKCFDRILGKYVLLSDNSIYYTSLSDGVCFKKISTSGKNKEIFIDMDVLPVAFQNSTFYYLDNENPLDLMALDLNTNSSHKVLSDDIYMPIIEGNMIYGIDIHDGYSLISLNMTDGTKTLLDSSRTDLINVTDNYIYYQTSGDMPGLKRIRRDGSGMEVVADGTYTNINATSQYVYFTNFGSDIPMYKTPAFGAVNVTTFDAASQAAANELLK